MKVTKVRIGKDAMHAIGVRYFEKESTKILNATEHLPKSLHKPYYTWRGKKVEKMAEEMKALGIPDQEIKRMMNEGTMKAVLKDFKKKFQK